MKIQFEMPSPAGSLFLVASDDALLGVHWTRQKVAFIEGLDANASEPAARILTTTVQQLSEYFAGKRTAFDLPLKSAGTVFQEKVWNALQQIPYGETRSYRTIAQTIRHGKAVRAVGTANGRNPLSIIVPCHRVIAANGTLGGYAGGLNIKAQLLELEGQQKTNSQKGETQG